MEKLSRYFLILGVVAMVYAIGVGLLITLAISPVLTGIVLLAGLLKLAKRQRVLTAFGTARLAKRREMEAAGMLSGKGLIIGRLPPPRWCRLKGCLDLLRGKIDSRTFLEAFRGKGRQLVRLPPSTVHVQIIAPSGAGKTSGLLIGYLLEDNG